MWSMILQAWEEMGERLHLPEVKCSLEQYLLKELEYQEVR